MIKNDKSYFKSNKNVSYALVEKNSYDIDLS